MNRAPAARVVLGLLLPGSAAGQAMPFYTPSALPLPLAESSVRTVYRHVELREPADLSPAVNTSGRLRLGVNSLTVMVPHGIARRIVVVAGVPYLWKKLEGPSGIRTNSGFGDALVMVKRELLAADFVAGNRRLAVFAGASFPTGQTKDRSGALPAPLRLGSGVVNLMAQAVYSHVDDRVGAHAAVGYRAAAAGMDGIRPGDRLGYDLALGYRIFPGRYRTARDLTLGTYLEVNGTIEQPTSSDGLSLEGTGGHTLLAAPGLQLIPLPNWAVETSLQLPLLRRLRGEQLTPSWSIAVGVRAVFFISGR
ncbi:MAG: hypothetical protein KatS3mg081_2501 [Gemmatimonadales bacterium]|nr:MAG: hypothetical protein KatS3mg081_2501 [Gemmatimonadales bacterium]